MRWKRLDRLEDRIAPAAIVRPYQPFTDSEVLAYVTGRDLLGGSPLITEPGGVLVRIPLGHGADPQVVVDQLAARADVAWASPNYVYAVGPGEFIPNDPLFSQQYHLSKIQSPAAWDVTTGSSNVIVAVADDGLAISHPDIAPNVWSNTKETPGNGIDDDANGFIDDVNGWDFEGDDNNVNPENGDTHGTHVAGIIGARTNNAAGVAGVAGGGVRIMPIRWVGNGVGTGTSADCVSALTYAADNGAKIVNMSHTFDGFVGDAAVTTAVNYAYGKGLLLINSAGNNDQADPSRGAFTQILFTAATDSNDQRTAFSNYGKYIDVSAPGMNVLSTTIDSGVFSYRMISGTSMASPNAAGVAALIWSAHPAWTRDQVAAQLIGSADRIDELNPGFEGQLGNGRVNAARGVSSTIQPPRVILEGGLPAEGGFTTTRNFTIGFDTPLRFDPATVSASSFELRGDGADNTFGTADDTLKTLVINGGATYRMGTDGFAITFTGNLAYDRYRFTAKAAVLKDPFGQSLDGDSDGAAGGDFTRTFRVSVSSIQGRVYEDLDNSLLFGTTFDAPLPGWTAFIDSNGNGQLDNGEPVAVTDGVGTYSFLDLSPGTYTVRRVTSAGWTDNRPSSGFYSVTLASSTSTSTANHFGQQRTNAAYGRTHEDLDGSGARESADPNLAGVTVFLDSNNNGVADTTQAIRSSVDVPKSLTFGTVTSVLTVSGVSGPITDLDVNLSIQHTSIVDLSLTLIAPGGRRVLLMAGTGGETDNLSGTVFDDEATLSVSSGVAPFSGRFRPASRLVDFDGMDPNGTWALEVVDDSGIGQAGSLTSWSLTIGGGESITNSDSNGLILLTAVPNGTGIVRAQPLSGWRPASPASGAATVSVGPGPALAIHFGQWRQNAAYGRFFNDANGNAAADSGETALSNWRAYADRNGNGAFDAPVVNKASTNVPRTIANMATTTSSMTVAGIPDPITDIDVNLSINHAHTVDIIVTLIAPDGRRVLLWDRVGTDFDDFTGTILDDEASTAIDAGTAPYTGRFRPQEPLSLLDGSIANGVWRLEVIDTFASYSGTIDSWSLDFETAEPSAISASHGGYAIANLTGPTTIRRVLQPGWGGTQPAADSYPLSFTAGDTVTGLAFGQRQVPPRVASIIINDGSAQRSRVTSLTIAFDRAVTFSNGLTQAFQLTRTGPGSPTGAISFIADSAASTSSRTVVTLSFPPLSDGNYQLSVIAIQVLENGIALDGDGNGSAGGNASFTFHRLFGDSDGDRTITAADFLAFRLMFLSNNPVFDFDGDGQVGPGDFLQFRLRFLTTI
ncbi:MAG: S8 family serine peptidase [Gemmataceae bacterium]|nr:S8 family serine peptidase [Gemmataceae bacterium]